MTFSPRRKSLFRLWVATLIGLDQSGGAYGAVGSGPISLVDVANTREIERRSSIPFSPDGHWLALTYQVAPDRAGAATQSAYSTTGVSGTEGWGRRQIQVVDVSSGAAIEIGDGGSSSWGPSWSPDGRRLAYYSDAGGEAGLWVWDVAARQSRRLGDAMVRPFWSFEIPRWTADGQHLLVKLHSQGEPDRASIARSSTQRRRPFSPSGPNDRASVAVFRSSEHAGWRANQERPGAFDELRSDLALVDTQSAEVRRIARGQRIGNYQIAPDQRHIAYSVLNTRRTSPEAGKSFQIKLHSLESAGDRTLVSEAQLECGNEFSWSPDGSSLAFLSRHEGMRRVRVVGVEGRGPISFQHIGESGELGDCSADTPLWDEAGRHIYIIGGGAVWRLDIASGQALQLPRPGGIELMQLTASGGSSKIWQMRGDAWVFARDIQTSEYIIGRLDLASGRWDTVFRGGEQSLDASGGDVSVSGQIAYLSTELNHPQDVWLYETRNGMSRQLTHLNPALGHHGREITRRIRWTSFHGEELSGMLLLPPRYKAGVPLPTVTWVYAGLTIDPRLRRYGLGLGSSFNPHVLTSRGFAVFVPEIPVRPGELIRDIHAAVVPGLNTIIEQGYADPERLAAMGQSFGSYSVWALLVQTDMFKAAITTGNVIHPDLMAQYLEMEPSTGNSLHGSLFEYGQVNMGGDPWSHRDQYVRNSIAYRLDNITTPLLMGQGSLDGDLRPSDAMFVALRRLGREVEYRIYENEGHVLQSRASIIDFWERRLEFLSEHLGSPSVPGG